MECPYCEFVRSKVEATRDGLSTEDGRRVLVRLRRCLRSTCRQKFTTEEIWVPRPVPWRGERRVKGEG